MDTEDLQSLVEDLTANIDDLEESLEPLLNAALSASTSKLPLLDKAKLYVLATYAIESVLFSYLRLNGVAAKEHPVFRELTRVKEYFEKIKRAESAGVKRNISLDKGAAGRFVKHALAGNDKYDQERKEREVREKAGAKRKFEDMTGVGTHQRFGGLSRNTNSDDAEEIFKKPNSSMEASQDEDSASAADGGRNLSNARSSKRQLKANMKRKQELARQGLFDDADEKDSASSNAEGTETIIPRKTKSSTIPKGHTEAFKALLNGPPQKVDEKKHRKKKRKSTEDVRAEEMH